MNTLARHQIGELYGCNAETLSSRETIRALLLETARRVGATVVGEAFHRFQPQGVSGTVVIEESHLSIHTWPERRYVAVDIFTCGGLDPRPGLTWLQGQLEADQSRVQEIVRGMPDDLSQGAHLLPDDVHVITEMATT